MRKRMPVPVPALAVTVSAAFLVIAASAATAPPATLLLEVHSPRAWFGSSALALQGPRDPVAMMTTWVYAPEEIIAYRPAGNKSAPAWTEDTTKDLKYQTLYVSASGRTAALPPGAVDSLAFWNRKPGGITGDCHLFGFNSAAAPDLRFGPPRPGSWHYNLTSDCTNINGAVPWPRFALSDDGATAVAWTQGAMANLTIFCLDGQTGALRWSLPVACVGSCDYFLSYGVDVSDDGRWVVFDDGTLGEPHRLNVLDAATGEPRCAPVMSAGAIPAHISPNGEFLYTSDAEAQPSTGAFSTWRWDAATGEYAKAGSGLPPISSHNDGWVSAEYAFSVDAATNTTYLGVVWFDNTLLGASILAVYDAAAPAKARSFYAMQPLNGTDMANAGAVVDCSGALCAAGFYTQKVGGPQHTLVALSGADARFAFTFTTPGSVDAVSIIEDRASGNYYLLGAGCQSVGVCTKPGGDAYLFELAP